MHDEPEKLYRRRLPHVRRSGATYFITWRLHARQRLLAPEERTIVFEAVRFFAGERHELLAAVVMDDHVHVVVAPHAEWPLSSLLHSWKSFTARALQRRGRTGAVWQDESFDRVVRDRDELSEKLKYVADNPAKRWPEVTEYRWLLINFGWLEQGADAPSDRHGGLPHH